MMFVCLCCKGIYVRSIARREKYCKVYKNNRRLALILNELLPKQAKEVMRAVKAKIPIMLIDNIKDDTDVILHKALRNAGAIIVPPCIMEYKKENLSYLCIYLNVKRLEGE